MAIIGTAAVTYGTYELCQYVDNKIDENRELERFKAFEEERWYRKVTKHPDHDPIDDEALSKDPRWEETTSEGEKKSGRKKFKNKATGEEVAFDKGKPGATGHEQYDHYHRKNPKSTNRHDEYFDNNQNPCGKYRDNYHLYNPNKEGSWEELGARPHS